MSDGTDVERAIAAGLPAADALLLAALRQRWWDRNDLTADSMGIPTVAWPDVDRALQHPAAPALDQVFIAALRRERSCPTSPVRSTS